MREPIHGLEVRAHNSKGLLAACEWVGSVEGAAIVSEHDFELHTATITNEEQSKPDAAAAEADNSLEGEIVLCEEVEMLCIKHEGERVRLQKADKKTIWRKAADVKRCES